MRQITGWLDEEAGWYGAFRGRDPEGLRACLDGSALPPWDVVESLLHDLAEHGDPRAAEAALPRARALHRVAVAAHDARRPDRAALDAALRGRLAEHAAAQQRAERLNGRLAAERDAWAAERLANELAWARDDAARAAARCAELRGRMAALPQAPATPPSAPPPPPPRGARFAGAVPAPAADVSYEAPAPATGSSRPEHAAAEPAPARPAPTAGIPEPGRPGPASAGPAGPADNEEAAPVPRGARFAGAPPSAAGPGTSGPTGPGARGGDRSPGGEAAASSPRGARFAGAAGGDGRSRRRGGRGGDPRAAERRDAARRLAGEAAATVAELRDAGRTGEAYARLSAAVAGPPEALPALAAELERTAGTAEVATLLWEAAALSPGKLAEAAGALAAAGRGHDARGLVRHAAARPVPELTEILAALARAGLDGESEELLDAFAGARTTDEAVELAAADPGRLVPLLLRAARRGPAQRHRRLAHALRSAGLPGAPDSA